MLAKVSVKSTPNGIPRAELRSSTTQITASVIRRTQNQMSGPVRNTPRFQRMKTPVSITTTYSTTAEIFVKDSMSK